MKAIDYEDNLQIFLESYNYQRELTNKLDRLDETPFNHSVINEIVLWKVNRYVSISTEVLQKIDQVKSLNKGQHRLGQSVLEFLLAVQVRGVDLPMASVFLRFRNPRTFQIIDRHAYRAIYDQRYPLNKESRIERKISTYFEYLDKLIELCTKRHLDFRTIDRLLYNFDRVINKKL